MTSNIKTPISDTIYARLCAAQRACEVKLRAQLAPLGLHVGQENVLILLHTAGQMNIAPLADALNMKLPTLSKMLERLHTAGMIERMADESDGRKAYVKLTPKGLDASLAARTAHEALQTELEALFDEKDLKKLRKLLKGVGSV